MQMAHYKLTIITIIIIIIVIILSPARGEEPEERDHQEDSAPELRGHFLRWNGLPTAQGQRGGLALRRPTKEVGQDRVYVFESREYLK